MGFKIIIIKTIAKEILIIKFILLETYSFYIGGLFMGLYKLMIVDDEEEIRLGVIKKLIGKNMDLLL